MQSLHPGTINTRYQKSAQNVTIISPIKMTSAPAPFMVKPIIKVTIIETQRIIAVIRLFSSNIILNCRLGPIKKKVLHTPSQVHHSPNYLPSNRHDNAKRVAEHKVPNLSRKRRR